MGIQRLINAAATLCFHRPVPPAVAQMLLALLVFAGSPGDGSAEQAHEPFAATSHRRFDDVEHWVKVFDDPERDAWQRPALVVTELGIEPGSRVADLGAGTGYFAATLSKAVGESGTVFAVETEPALVAHLLARAEREELTNLVPVLASTGNPRLPAASIDLLLIVDTFHHIDDRLSYFADLRQVLAPGGRVAIIDWKKEKLPVGPAPDHKLAREQVVREMQQAQYELAAQSDQLPYQYFLIFRPRPRPAD